MLEIPNRSFLFFERLKVIFMFKYKCHNKIQYNWRAYSKKRKINKVHTYGITFNTKFLSPPCANTIGFLLKPNCNVAYYCFNHLYNSYYYKERNNLHTTSIFFYGVLIRKA